MSLRVAIVGRPNVGKSTLFNRLLGRRRALVHDRPGVTRDRLEEATVWQVGGRELDVRLIDTGGVFGQVFEREIREQVGMALRDADAVLAVFDGRAGLLPDDRELVRDLAKRTGLRGRIPIFAVVNKIDSPSAEELTIPFLELGLPVIAASAEHGRGAEEIRDSIVEAIGEKAGNAGEELPSREESDPETREIPRVAVVGRPNVGKSTLVNALLGDQRMITSPVAGTTIDSVDSPVRLGGRDLILVDTAGIRRKSKTESGVEVLSVVQARKSLDRADVALLLLDGSEGTNDQDEKIAGLVEKAGAGLILVLNKWDLMRGRKGFTPKEAEKWIRARMRFLDHAPLLFASAKEGGGLDRIGPVVWRILEGRSLKVGTHELTEWVRREVGVHNPKNAKFYLCHQASRHPPTFVCHVSDPEKVHFSLKRHLIRGIREKWGYEGLPVRLVLRKGKG